MSTPRRGPRLAVDPIRCIGYGVCTDLFPERLTPDDWGYPIVDPRPIDGSQVDDALRAVRACPGHALRLIEPE